MFSMLAAACLLVQQVRKDVIEEVVNDQAPFMLGIDVNSKSRTYRAGDYVEITAKSEHDCYLYIFDCNSKGAVQCIFPTMAQPNNRIARGVEVKLPAPNSKVRYPVRPPYGEETLLAIGSIEPLDDLLGVDLRKGNATPIDGARFVGLKNALAQRNKSQWAEFKVSITTGVEPPTTSRRCAVCIGINDYQAPGVRDLSRARSDAEHITAALQSKCGVPRSDLILLRDAEASKEAIRRAIFEVTRDKTRPGDTVFIYFSGHGMRLDDDNGDEPDGKDEYIVPWDGIPNQPKSMIQDDEFARWLRELDGRSVVIVLDNCFSGGATKGIDASRGIGGPPDARARNIGFDFLDGELNRCKDVSRNGTNMVMLAASQATEESWEFGTLDSGVFTYFLIKSLSEAADTNGDGHLSPGEVHAFVETRVSTYVRDKLRDRPGVDQRPEMLDNSDGTIVFRP